MATGSIWFFKQKGRKFGPVTSQQLRDLASKGKLFPTDTIWSEGMKEWVPTTRLKGIRFPKAKPESRS